MTRRALILLCAALAGCAGPAARTQPLLIARPDVPVAAAAVSVDLNSLLLRLPASTVNGCATLAGEYQRSGGSVTVRLRQVPSTTSCDGTPRSFTTTIGPLPPGDYSVTVSLDGREIVSSPSVRIG